MLHMVSSFLQGLTICNPSSKHFNHQSSGPLCLDDTYWDGRVTEMFQVACPFGLTPTRHTKARINNKSCRKSIIIIDN